MDRQSPPPRSKDQSYITPSERAQAVELPFDRYELQLPEYYRIANAKDALTRQCMESRGFDWPSIERPIDVQDLRNRRRYGVIEPKVAREFGYHNGATLTNPYGVKEKEEARRRSLKKEVERAALSRPSGCAYKAIAKMKKKIRNDVDLALFNRLGEKAMRRSMKTSGVVRVFAAWSDCMKGAGVNYSEPYDASNDKAWWRDRKAQRASPREIQVAKRDVHCKQKVHLVDVWQKAEAKQQESLIRQNESYFRELLHAKKAKLDLARQVVRSVSQA